MSSVLRNIQVKCTQRRIRLEEFMRTFDIHKHKVITKDQFYRALDNAGMNLSRDEMQALAQEYQVPGEPTKVNYRVFCDQVDEAFIVKGLEKNPMANIRTEVDLTTNFVPAQNLSLLEQEEIKVLKEKLIAIARTKGIVLKDVYRDFDRNNSGNVTKQQFLRNVFSVFTTISEADADLLVKAYGNNSGGVNYRELHVDVCHPQEASGESKAVMPKSMSALSALSPRSSALQLTEKTETRLLALVQKERIRVKSFFTDFDRLRTGKCTSEQFKRGLKVCFGAAITSEEMDALALKYGGSASSSLTDAVSYSAFSDAVNPDQQYLQTLVDGSATRRTSQAGKSSKESTRLDTLMEKLHLLCTTRRVLIKPVFQDFDKRRQGAVTRDQFFRVLTMFDMLPENESDKNLLANRYSKNSGFVDFIVFCNDLETWNQGKQSTATDLSPAIESVSITAAKDESHNYGIASAQTRSFPMLMRVIKEKVKRDRLRIDENFRDHDLLRKGKITVTQFSSGMSKAGFRFSNDEIATIAAEYKYEEANAPSQFAWMKFVEDINSIFTLKGLERDPLRNVESSVREAESLEVDTDTQLDGLEEQELREVLNQIQQAISRKRLFIKPLFEDFDKAKRGYIPSSKFERALSIFQLLPSKESQLKVIIKKFGDSKALGSAATRPDVNYRAFLNALDDISIGSSEIAGTIDYRKRQQVTTSSSTTGVSQGPSGTRKSSNQVELNDVLASIRDKVVAKRLRIKEFMSEGDKLRTGEITVTKFHTALNRLGLLLEPAELDCLARSFVSSKNIDRVNWRKFIEAIENPSSAPQPSEAEDQLTKMPAASQEQVDALLERIRSTVVKNRLHMKPYFQDYDRNNLNKVTPSQFSSVLDMMKISLQPKEVDLLCRAFQMSHGRKQTKDVNYHAFVRRINEELE